MNRWRLHHLGAVGMVHGGKEAGTTEGWQLSPESSPLRAPRAPPLASRLLAVRQFPPDPLGTAGSGCPTRPALPGSCQAGMREPRWARDGSQALPALSTKGGTQRLTCGGNGDSGSPHQDTSPFFASDADTHIRGAQRQKRGSEPDAEAGVWGFLSRR